MSLNKVFISGNITRDPELRATSGGTSVLGFGVAVNERRKNPQSGEWDDRANFFDCSVFGKRAESLSRILHKGMKCCIEGKLRWSQWNDKNGQKRSKVEIIVDEIEFMSRRDQGEAQNQPQQQQVNNYTNQYQNGPHSAPQQPAQDDYADDYIPF
jgi:single-strand DNA-binding protein